MNERIKELEKQCWTHRVDGALIDGHLHFDTKKFAELLEKEFEAKHFSAGYIAGKSDGIIETVRECGVALSPMLRDMISRGKAVELINKHIGVEE